MRKLGALLAVGTGICGAGLAGPAVAFNAISLQCSTFTPAQVVGGLDASSGITPPASF